MANQSDFMRGWLSGWAAATGALTQSLNHALQSGGAAQAIRTTPPTRADISANQPVGRRRGRPPKSAVAPWPQSPRRRGRPPKIRTI
jgi:hypothetical protein